MKKIKMTITIDDQFEVSTKFSGKSGDLTKCNRALAKHLKQQSRISHVLANAASLADDDDKATIQADNSRSAKS